MSLTSNINKNSDKEPANAYRWFLLSGVWTLYFAFGLTLAAMAPLVGTIRNDLNINDSTIGLILGAWPLIYIASAVPCGAFLDKAGPRWALLASGLIMATSCAARGLSTDQVSLFLAVAGFGIGGPLISIGAPKLVATWFKGKQRGLAMGIYITGPALGSILALSATNSIAMPLLENNWRHVMFLYSGVVVCISLTWMIIASRPQARRMEQPHLEEKNQPQGRIFLTLLREPMVTTLLIMAIGVFFFNHSLNNWLPEILRRGGMSASQAGYWATIPALVGILGSLMIPRLAIPSRRNLLLFGLIIGAAGSSLLLQHSESPIPLSLGLAMQGLARGSLMTILMLSLVEMREVGTKHAGAAGGLFFSFAEVGGVLGPVCFGILSDMTGSFTSSLYMLTLVCSLLLLLLNRLHRLHRQASA
ncbi:MAG: MFS transporter [Pseudomonadota bacterium]|nr:MFS transporter [Pseudomonadota bacterium]